MKTKPVARGVEQRRWMSNMQTGGHASVAYELRGKAKRYTLRYVASFTSLCKRMDEAGYQITRTPGSRGGEWSAVYRAEIMY